MADPVNNLDSLAAKIRAECLSGYNWNVPKHWRDVHPEAKQRWRERAAFKRDQDEFLSKEQ